MSQEIRNLEPKTLWNKFADLNAVPRPSKKEERVIEFMKNFGAGLGLETFEDEIRNVIIRKPATAGMENRKTLVLQGHLHFYEDIFVNNIHFVTGGAVCSKWWQGKRNGLEEGFLIVKVKNQELSFEYKDYGWLK